MNKADSGMKYPMFFLGVEDRQSKKSGNAYQVAKFQQDGEKPEIFSFYVSGQDEGLKNEIGVLRQFQKYDLILSLTGFNGKPEVKLIGIGGEAG